jgi:Ca2+:H+ antiporter
MSERSVANIFRCLGSIEAPSGATTPSQPSTPYLAARRESGSTSSSLRKHMAESTETPPPVNKAKRPSGPGRRVSTKLHAYHHKHGFSVDDYESEVEEELYHSEASTSGYGTLRRKPSNLRRRTAGVAQSSSLPTLESTDDLPSMADREQNRPKSIREPTVDEEAVDEELVNDAEANATADDEGDEDLSDAESFTLKDRQEAINETHPFGIRIWKPALYKKDRSVQKTAEGDIHSSPGGRVNRWLVVFNFLWTVLFGWWLACLALLGAGVCFLFGVTPSGYEYGVVLLGLAQYIFYPFGKFVKLEQDEAYAAEDEGEGRSITEYEQWQTGDIEEGRLFFGPTSSSDPDHRGRSLVGRRRTSVSSLSETDSLLGRGRRHPDEQSAERDARKRRRLFGRGQWTVGRVIFFLFFYFAIAPTMLIVSGLCWLFVFTIPMGKVLLMLFYHLRRHPLALSFHNDSSYSRSGPGSPSSSILLCTYRAVGWKYYKYTIDGTNIFFINLMGVVFFTIFDYYVLGVALGMVDGIAHPGIVFTLALFSIIPLAYFIGQAVASISAQSSMGLGAAINAFFSTVVEVYLYCAALKEGKGPLVEGSVIGSILAGVLVMPGLSMCFGAIKRKTQRFNSKSAGVTSTMLLFAVIAAFGPTLFYQIYGTVSVLSFHCTDTFANLDIVRATMQNMRPGIPRARQPNL